MTGDENPNQQQFHNGGGFGHPGGFGGFGINIEDLMRGGFFGHPGGHPGQGQRQQGQQRRGGGRTTYTFSYGGGEGMRF